MRGRRFLKWSRLFELLSIGLAVYLWVAVPLFSGWPGGLWAAILLSGLGLKWMLEYLSTGQPLPGEKPTGLLVHQDRYSTRSTPAQWEE